ncbi:MAG: rhomboid family intramembrane serine protease [Lachnospiraceae bacterium]|nr:rhomboid family intramembrane serine protease [Lachnospiraceae bacterium]
MGLSELLQSRGYVKRETSSPAVSFYFRTEGRTSRIIQVLDLIQAYVRPSESIAFREELRRAFAEKGYTDIEQLTILLTLNTASARPVCAADPATWIMDARSMRLIVYEDSVMDFDCLRKPLEEMCLQAAEEMERTAAEATRRLPFRKNSEATLALILLNVIVFAALSAFGDTKNAAYMARHGALYSSYILTDFELYRLFTCMFMHFGFLHLLENMFILYFVGSMVENTLGKGRFLIIYFVSGIFSGIAMLFVQLFSGSNSVAAGASGAIFGIIGTMFMILIKNHRFQKRLVLPLLVLAVSYALFMGLTAGGAGNAAHVGGLLAGLFLSAILYRPRHKKFDERV